MQDRIPTYPGRVLVTPESGATPYYATITMADEPTQVGTPPTTANLLTADTAAIIGSITSAADPQNVDRALYTLGKTAQRAVVAVYVGSGNTARLTDNLTPTIQNPGTSTPTVTAGSDGFARIPVPFFGTWHVFSSAFDRLLPITSIGIDEVRTYYVLGIQSVVDSTIPWSDIQAIAKAGAARELLGIGWKKTFNMSGVEYEARIIGIDHDAPNSVTFQVISPPDVKPAMNTSNTNTTGWKNCALRLNIIPTYLAGMDSDLVRVLKEVKKFTSVGGTSPATESTYDTLFILSEVEQVGGTIFSFAGEGKPYEYYSGISTREGVVVTVSGNASGQLLRSPYTGNSNNFCAMMGANSDPGYSSDATYGSGCMFAFVVG